MYNIAIIEDDAIFSENLKNSILKFAESDGKVFNIAQFDRIETFMLPRQVSFDIVFFDIELPGMNGMDGAKKFRMTDSNAIIIFVTSLAHYAVNGYEVDAMDYMVKPITYNNLALKLSKAMQKIENRQYKTITIHGREGLTIVRSIDIYYVEVRGHDIAFHTNNGVIETTGCLSDYEEQLQNNNFSRCNSCYLVNMRAIVRIDGMTVWLRNGESILISRRKKKDFFNEFTGYLGK
jgi:DNA-binding LytR/AlgR family response regulator